MEGWTVEEVEFGSLFPRPDPLALEESGGLVLVEPQVTVDPRGGFLIADHREARILRYDVRGRLLWHTGRRGGGPGEFEAPSEVRRLPDGRIVAIDRPGVLSVHAPGGDVLLETHRLPLRGLIDLEVLDDSTLLITGTPEEGPIGARIHRWDLEGERLLSSFFRPLSFVPNRDAAIMAGWTRVAVRDDTIAATFSTADTIYRFTPDGQAIDRLPLPSRHFRRVETSSGEGRTTDPGEIGSFIRSFDLVADIHWMRDGRYVVPYQQVEPDGSLFRLSRIRHLIVIDPEAVEAREVRSIPRLVSVDASSGLFFFYEPENLLPNQWIVAKPDLDEQ